MANGEIQVIQGSKESSLEVASSGTESDSSVASDPSVVNSEPEEDPEAAEGETQVAPEAKETPQDDVSDATGEDAEVIDVEEEEEESPVVVAKDGDQSSSSLSTLFSWGVVKEAAEGWRVESGPYLNFPPAAYSPAGDVDASKGLYFHGDIGAPCVPKDAEKDPEFVATVAASIIGGQMGADSPLPGWVYGLAAGSDFSEASRDMLCAISPALLWCHLVGSSLSQLAAGSLPASDQNPQEAGSHPERLERALKRPYTAGDVICQVLQNSLRGSPGQDEVNIPSVFPHQAVVLDRRDEWPIETVNPGNVAVVTEAIAAIFFRGSPGAQARTAGAMMAVIGGLCGWGAEGEFVSSGVSENLKSSVEYLLPESPLLQVLPGFPCLPEAVTCPLPITHDTLFALLQMVNSTLQTAVVVGSSCVVPPLDDISPYFGALGATHPPLESVAASQQVPWPSASATATTGPIPVELEVLEVAKAAASAIHCRAHALASLRVLPLTSALLLRHNISI